MATAKPFEFFVQWHITEDCNLACRHCYQGERSREELPGREMKKVVGEVSDMIKDWSDTYGVEFSPSMNITGGEPFLNSNLYEILGDIKKQGFKTYVLTNGTVVDQERAKRLADLGVDGVQVSIEGPEDVHDGIRGRGSFSASRDGVEHLVDAKVPVTLNVTLSAVNASSLKAIVAFGSHVGARGGSGSPVSCRQGRAGQ
jgi:MoaA/NifB/PqqE/SkfB family radical SAM enzyme